jgi:hypothetical protein
VASFTIDLRVPISPIGTGGYPPRILNEEREEEPGYYGAFSMP